MAFDRDAYATAVAHVFTHTDNAAARYKLAFRGLGLAYNAGPLAALRPLYLQSDVIEQLSREQRWNGGWGPLRDKDYSVKAAFPTTFVALERCLYLGLTLEDSDILLRALEYLELYLQGTPPEPLYNKNERAIPWQMAEIAGWAERIQPGNPHVDRLFYEWVMIAVQAFAGGAYSHERDAAAQHTLLGTREKRLVPMPLDLLLARRDALPEGMEAAMRDHYGLDAFQNGFFWAVNLLTLPETFAHKHARRAFHTVKYINRFHGTARYLAPYLRWLWAQRGEDGFWDWGPQVNDPWGYHSSFSLARRDKKTRTLDCTMEVLDVIGAYLANNPDT